MKEYATRSADGSLVHEGAAHAARATAPPIMPSERSSATPPKPVRTGTPTEQELRALLSAHHGNVAAVGREFGKERMQVHRWLKRYGIDVAQYR
jgi:transcriptional regulator of acetoin/glycerol metabolism